MIAKKPIHPIKTKDDAGDDEAAHVVEYLAPNVAGYVPLSDRRNIMRRSASAMSRLSRWSRIEEIRGQFE